MNWQPAQWTIEMAVRCDQSDGWRTFIGRGGSSFNIADSDLYIQRVDNGQSQAGQVRIRMKPASGTNIDVYSGAANTVPAGKWFGLAITSDGTTLKMYMDKNDGAGYQLVGSTAFPSGTSPIQNTFPASSLYWCFGEGWYGGNPGDPLEGALDNVRFSDEALTPSQMINQLPTPPFEFVSKTEGWVLAGDVDITVNAKEVGKTLSSVTMTIDGASVTPAVVKTGTDIAINYSADLAEGAHKVFVRLNGPAPEDAMSTDWTINAFSDQPGNAATVIHHWDFNQTDGTNVPDQVGTNAKDGTVIGTNHTWTGEAIYLNGTGTSVNWNTNIIVNAGSYIDFPDGLLNDLPGAATIEIVYKDAGSGNWARVYDFGTSVEGENLSMNGSNYIFLTGGDLNDTIRTAIKAPNASGEFAIIDDEVTKSVTNGLTHVVFTYDPTAARAAMYINGELAAANIALVGAVPLSDINDVNNWIGRSQFQWDAMFKGEIDDFKMYTGILTSSQVATIYANLTGGGITFPPVIDRVSVSNNLFNIEYRADDVGTYAIERRTSLTGAWTVLTNGIGSGNQEVSVQMTPGAAQEFYRVTGE